MIALLTKAVFKQLCSDVNRDDCILITGKGYPDRLTSQFVSRVAKQYKESVRFLGFADSDAHGIHILFKYQTGHFLSAKPEVGEPATVRNQVNGCPQLEFSGVLITDYQEGWMPLSKKDFSFAKLVLQKVLTAEEDEKLAQSLRIPEEDEKPAQSLRIPEEELAMSTLFHNYKRELQRQMLFHKKCEMNVVGNIKKEFEGLYALQSKENLSRVGIYVGVKLKQAARDFVPE